jgi:arabinofuranan 3-O-arabinosyltransferase
MNTSVSRASEQVPPTSLQPVAWPSAETVAYAVLGTLVVLAVFLNQWGSFTPDTEPQLYLAPGRVLIQSLFSWKSSPALGQPNFQTGVAPVAAIIFVIRALGASAWVAVRVWRALLLLVAAWGAVRFYRRLAGDRAGPAGGVAAALLYVANPYVVVSGASTPVLLPYALFPWMMLAFARSVDEPKGWRWPAAFALVFFLMGGLNAGIVPLFLLLGIPAYLLYARIVERAPVRGLVGPFLKGGLLVALSSAYWIIPSIAAKGTASTIAVTTERPADVASTSSYAESLRLLGLWPLYGRQGAQPFLPSAVGYITNAWVVLATFAIPVAAAIGALLSRVRARVLAATLLAIGSPVMVGLFPPRSPTPFGRALSTVFDRFPTSVGFRTTNKVGALVALALVLLIALGAGEAWGWLRRRPVPLRALILGLAGVAVLGSVFPAWTGNLYGAQSTDVPSYWHRAAHALNAGSPDTRVLFLPGEEFAQYRWGKRGPTDLNDSLLSRPSVLRLTVPNGSAYSANLLAALDVPLNDGSYVRGTIPTLARYLGVRDILVRNDLAWEAWGGARPSTIDAILESEQGLRRVATYGKRGEFTTPPRTARAGTQAAEDARLPPLARYVVSGARGIVRAERVGGTVLLDGDNFGLAQLVGLGLLPGDPAFRFLGSMSPADLSQALQSGARVILTDTNRRRAWNFRRTGVDYSATLGPDQTYGGGDLSFRLFGGDTSTQTVALLDGARSVTATGYGSVFSPVPWNQPVLAFDGDPHTAWLAGGLGAAFGQAITVAFDGPREISRLVLRPVLGGSRQIGRVQIRAGSTIRNVDLAAGRDEVSVRFPVPVTASSLTVTVTGIRGSGLNPVGFWGIDIPGVSVHAIARLPLSVEKATSGLDAAGRAALARTPIDVVLVRQAGSPSTAFDDEEPNLYRQFAMPNGRIMTFTAVGRLASTLTDQAIDRLVGLPADVVATSSSRASITDRASAALDGDVPSAWVPDGDPVGQFIDVRFPPAELRHIVVDQGPPARGPLGLYIAKAGLSLNGGPLVQRSLTQGRTMLTFPRQLVHEVRLRIDGVGGLGGRVRLNELQVGNLTVPATDQRSRLSACFRGFEVDGRAVAVQTPATIGRLTAGLPVTLTPCHGATVSLSAGSHRISPVDAWQLDELHLSSSSSMGASPPAGPQLSVESSTPTRTTVTTDGAEAPYYLVLGQGYDPRWRATMDGKSLGPPILVDGYSTAWIVRSPGAHTFVLEFGPQHWMNLSLAVSLLAVAGMVGIVARRRRRG